MYKYLIACLLLTACATASAQSVEFSKDRFGNDKDGLKAAQKDIKAGDAFYELDPPRYEQALVFYLKAQQFNPSNDQLNLKIGDCYLHSGFKPRALEYLQRAYQLNPDVSPRIHYLLGRGLHLNAKWDAAIAEYKRAVPASGAKNTAGLVLDIQKKIKECENGRRLAARPTRVFIDNAGPGVNSPYPDYGPVITADESVILFTSRREGSTGGKTDPELGGYFEDIYQSTREGKDDWSAARNLGETINTDGHDATVGLSPDGQRLLVYLEDNGGDLHQAELRGTEWRKPQKLGARINSKSHESSASYTPDGRNLFFVSDKGRAAWARATSTVSKLKAAGRPKTWVRSLTPRMVRRAFSCTPMAKPCISARRDTTLWAATTSSSRCSRTANGASPRTWAGR